MWPKRTAAPSVTNYSSQRRSSVLNGYRWHTRLRCTISYRNRSRAAIRTAVGTSDSESEAEKKIGANCESVMGWGHRDSKLAPEKCEAFEGLIRPRMIKIAVICGSGAIAQMY